MKGVLATTCCRWCRWTSITPRKPRTLTPPLTKVSNGNMVKVLAWYDNEWGFSCQMLNTARAMFAA